MKNFIKIIKEKDREISTFYEQKELQNIKGLLYDLEGQHRSIKENLVNVNYLLDLIEAHTAEIKEAEKNLDFDEADRSNWFDRLVDSFEKLHIMHIDELTKEDVEFLRKEKSKLLYERNHLEREHHHVHELIAKTSNFLADTCNLVCKEISGGYDIAQVAEKLRSRFGTEIEETQIYSYGKKMIVEFLISSFALNRVKVERLFTLLEQRKVIYYKVDYNHFVMEPNYDVFPGVADTSYSPVYGHWFING